MTRRPKRRRPTPRDFVYKRRRVIILTDVGVVMGHVETHHGYSIELVPGVPGRDAKTGSEHLIGEDSIWPEDWRWMFAPEKEKKNG